MPNKRYTKLDRLLVESYAVKGVPDVEIETLTGFSRTYITSVSTALWKRKMELKVVVDE